MKLVVRKKYLADEILYRSLDPPKKRRQDHLPIRPEISVGSHFPMYQKPHRLIHIDQLLILCSFHAAEGGQKAEQNLQIT